ncbi:MAG: methyltransferase MtaB domain-containing protein [Bryobacteraceae bacterium]
MTVADAGGLVFGRAPRPVTCGFDLSIGDGRVYPEVNFTLPAMSISAETWGEVCAQYEQIARTVLQRAVALQTPGLVLEFELLPAMTEIPEWGAEITAILHRHLAEAHARHGLRSALRVTPTDIRDQRKPPELRSGEPWDRVKRCFELSIAAGADILSIESVGGKEVHDQALLYGDVRGVVFALGVLAPRDMAWLWDYIVGACRAHNHAVPGGDTACGFANTAMQLAHQKMLPEVLAAVVRAMCAARSLVAFERGAVGPSKDCAYEGPIIKAISGAPISMEGKSATCAHFSPVGNISAAMADLWSNESVQNIRLLSGEAPAAYAELLAYDCRLMNVAASRGEAIRLRDWLIESDRALSPQAALMSPDAVYRIGAAIVSEQDGYRRTVAAGRTAIEILNEQLAADGLALSGKERQWLKRLETEFAALPASSNDLLDEMHDKYSGVFDPAAYGISARSTTA